MNFNLSINLSINNRHCKIFYTKSCQNNSCYSIVDYFYTIYIIRSMAISHDNAEFLYREDSEPMQNRLCVD